MMFSIILPVVLVCVASLLTESAHASHHELKKNSLIADIDKLAKKTGAEPDGSEPAS